MAAGKAVMLQPAVPGGADVGAPIDLAREKGVSAYIGEGANAGRRCMLPMWHGYIGWRWRGRRARHAYHAVADNGVRFREIAEAIGRKRGLRVESRDAAYVGWFAGFASEDVPAFSEATRQQVGWQPSERGLLADIAQPAYYAGRRAGTRIAVKPQVAGGCAAIRAGRGRACLDAWASNTPNVPEARWSLRLRTLSSACADHFMR